MSHLAISRSTIVKNHALMIKKSALNIIDCKNYPFNANIQQISFTASLTFGLMKISACFPLLNFVEIVINNGQTAD